MFERLLSRLGQVLGSWAMTLDQFANALITGLWYLLTARGDCPNPDESISSNVGRHAILGKRWALVLEALINPVFALLGQPNHCRTAALYGNK